MQTVRDKLLVADTDGEVKIVRYAGGGSLRGLVKVTAVRTAISLLRKHKGGARNTIAARCYKQTGHQQQALVTRKR